MFLYLLRHGIAADRGVFTGADAGRPLTSTGRKKMRKIARGMRALGLTFDLVVSSPFARARETAEIVTTELGCEDLLEFSAHLEVGGDPASLVAELAHRTAQSILLVGHEPQLGELVSVLVTGNDALSVSFKKGGLCKLAVESLRFKQCATLEWLLTPSHLAGLR